MDGGDSGLLHGLFEEQARRTPRATALVDELGSLTYEELDRQAGLLAAHLRDAGVGPDKVVGVYMERRSEFVVSCLAALKAGGAFLPLELAYPDALLGGVLDDARPRVVLTLEHHAERLPKEQTRFHLDGDWEKSVETAPGTGSGPRLDPSNLAFVSYSSGTTGRPKGIANPHRAAVRSYLWRFGISDYGPGDVVGCNVFFVWEMLRPLLRGGTTCVIPDGVIYDPPALVRFMEEFGITETLFTPSLLEAVLDSSGPELSETLAGLETLWLNGEVVTKTLARRALRLLPGTRLMNVYSISETHEVAAGDLRELLESPSTYCPVGRPMDPDHLYILDEDARPVPDGTAGELYVGGGGLARGYVNLPEKTAERFVEDPFSTEGGARMYRSGDRARLLPDGNLEVMGRIDFMVKVRGYSVELGAVEAAIERHLAVSNCVVVAEGEEGGDKRLVAYLVPSDDAGDGRYAGWDVDPATGRSPEIRRRLGESLPHYMIPAVYVETAALPLQETSGKVDRKNLPAPPARAVPVAAGPEPALPADAPRPEKEARIARIFEAVLLLERGDVGRDEDFFDIGGHSLAAAQLLGEVEKNFGVHLSVAELLEDPTVAGVCDSVETGRSGASDARAPLAGTDLLRAEAVLEPGISLERAAPGVASLRDAECVFLTGATGFLGAFLLDELLSRTDAEIRCLVRPRGGGAGLLASIRENLKRYGLWRPERAGRVVPVAGDLSEPLFGMAEGDFDRLAREVDVIFHAGAVVNLIYPYPALAPPNVGGTREVLRLACRHQAKPLHHVSTNGIFPPGQGVCREDEDLDALAGARWDGYGQSKWVAEKLVLEAAGRGLPVRVYRPGNISGHSDNGASNPRDWLGSVLVEALRSGRAPEVSGWRMEMTPVDFVARAILHVADSPDVPGRVFHLANPDPVPAERVFARFEALGYPLERLPYEEWLEAVSGDDEVGSVLRGAAPEVSELRDGSTYDDRNLYHALGDDGPRRPAIDVALLAAYARHFVGRGWVEAPSRSRAVPVRGGWHSS